MATNRYFLTTALLLILILNLNFQCRKSIAFNCAETKYNFEIGIRAYPDKEVINVGDTIWLEVNTPDILKDNQTGAMIDYSGVENLGSGISFSKLNNNSFTIKALSKFKLLLIKGEEVINSADPNLLREYNFEDKDGLYQFKLGIIPLESGIYGFIVSSAANVYRKSDRCTKASFTINFTETNQHYPLNPNFQGGPTPVGGDYYFKVN